MRIIAGLTCIVVAFWPAQIAFISFMFWIVPRIIPRLRSSFFYESIRFRGRILEPWEVTTLAVIAGAIAVGLIAGGLRLLWPKAAVARTPLIGAVANGKGTNLRRLGLVFKAYIIGYIMIFPVWLSSMPGTPGTRDGPSTEDLMRVALGLLISFIALNIIALNQRTVRRDGVASLAFAIAALFLFADALHYAFTFYK